MKHPNNVNYDYEHDVQSGEGFGLKAVVTVERNYDAELSLGPRIDSKAEITEKGIQRFNPYQKIFNQASTYHLAEHLKNDTDSYFEHQKQDRKGLENLYNKIERFSENECKSIVIAHDMYSGNLLTNMNLDKGSFKSILISIFKSQQYPILYFHELVKFKANNQLPDSSLNWVKYDLRCALYVAHLMQNNLENRVFVGGIELTDYIADYLKYENINFNYSDLNLPSYKNISPIKEGNIAWRIESIKSYYFSNHIDDEMKWFKNDDEKQIEWAYKYLSQDKRNYLILQGNFKTVSLEDKYNLILASLDVLSNADYTYEIFTKNIDTRDPNFDFELIPVISYRAKVIENMKDAWDKFSVSNKNGELSKVEIYKKNQNQLEAIMKFKETTSSKKALGEIIEDAHNRIFSKN